VERIPQAPEVAANRRASGHFRLSYEDIAQDGRLLLHGIPKGMGCSFWAKAAPQNGIDHAMRERGVVPILVKMWTQGGAGPVGLGSAVRADARFEYERVDDEAGEVDKLVLSVWVELKAPPGTVHGEADAASDSEELVIGRVFTEHIFTRLFAKRGERKVTRLEGSRLPEVPQSVRSWQQPVSLLDLPDGAVPIDDMTIDQSAVVFGVDHTDSNQHVNALVYPRLFREAALRRMATLGLETNMIARSQQTAYRKPSFAGDRCRIALSCFRLGDAVGATACLLDGDDPKRGRIFDRVMFE
jgi:hypothetical protein